MRNLKTFTYGAVISLTLLAPAFAQDTTKTLADNSKATVTEATVAVGAVVKVNAATGGPFFARYYLTGGTVEYTYADGKKETVVRKTGSAVIISATDKRPTSIKNIGNTAIHVITVAVK